MSPRVSVIIPVYNVERYLDNCIKSVLNQTFHDFEVILVDDGSTDMSGKMCDSYASNQVFVLHKPNGGLSDARNAGTKIAKGEYITWVDSDDLIHKDYLKILFHMAEKFNSDLACANILPFEEDLEINVPKESYYCEFYDNLYALKQMLIGKLHGTSACALLVRKQLALQFPFPLGKYHEDDLTTYNFYIHANNVSYTNQPLYFYMQRKGSIMHKPFSQVDIDELDAADTIYDECSKIGVDYGEAALVKKYANYFRVLYKYDNLKEISPDTFYRIQEFLHQESNIVIFNRYIPKKMRLRYFIYKLSLIKKFKF